MLPSRTFVIPGAPRGKGRPRFARVGGGVRTYTDAKTAAYENLIRLAYRSAHTGESLLSQPVRVVILAVFPIPVSWPRAKREAAKWHTAKPDGDNVFKVIADALNGLCWTDDSLVVDHRVIKQYGPEPRAIVTVIPL